MTASRAMKPPSAAASTAAGTMTDGSRPRASITVSPILVRAGAKSPPNVGASATTTPGRTSRRARRASTGSSFIG
jgi:hypothetical protein